MRALPLRQKKVTTGAAAQPLVQFMELERTRSEYRRPVVASQGNNQRILFVVGCRASRQPDEALAQPAQGGVNLGCGKSSRALPVNCHARKAFFLDFSLAFAVLGVSNSIYRTPLQWSGQSKKGNLPWGVLRTDPKGLEKVVADGAVAPPMYVRSRISRTRPRSCQASSRKRADGRCGVGSYRNSRTQHHRLQ